MPAVVENFGLIKNGCCPKTSLFFVRVDKLFGLFIIILLLGEANKGLQTGKLCCMKFIAEEFCKPEIFGKNLAKKRGCSKPALYKAR